MLVADRSCYEMFSIEIDSKEVGNKYRIMTSKQAKINDWLAKNENVRMKGSDKTHGIIDRFISIMRSQSMSMAFNGYESGR